MLMPSWSSAFPGRGCNGHGFDEVADLEIVLIPGQKLLDRLVNQFALPRMAWAHWRKQANRKQPESAIRFFWKQFENLNHYL